MQYRCFLNTVVAALLGNILFFGNCVTAQVVHAYRKPDEADLQWLLGDASTPSSASDIVQVGYHAPAHTKPALTPRCEPCQPAQLPKLPKQTIPPAPEITDEKPASGIAPDKDGVVNIAPVFYDSATPIVQMSAERLPPPSHVPADRNGAVSATDSMVERLSIPNLAKVIDTPEHSPVRPCDAALACKTHKKCQHGCTSACGHDCKHGGTVFYVPDMLGGSAWLAGYGVGTTTMQPTMLLSRSNVMEHFNAEVRNRIWADYRHWNNAVSLDGNSRAVDQFSFGLEKRLLRRASIELRVPLIGQFASNQTANETAMELGNVSVFLKQVLAKNSRWTISGGLGATLPTAEDYRSSIGRFKNNASYLVSFLGVQWHPNQDTFGHFVVQTDIPLDKNELVLAASSPMKVEGLQMFRTGIQLGHWIYRSDCRNYPCRLGSFVEVDYVVATDGVPVNGSKSALSAAVGMPMVFGKLTCTNSVILPISGSDNPFSVGYNFSMMRQF